MSIFDKIFKGISSSSKSKGKKLSTTASSGLNEPFVVQPAAQIASSSDFYHDFDVTFPELALGIHVEPNPGDKLPRVAGTIPNGTAAQAGVLPGDIVIAVEGLNDFETVIISCDHVDLFYFIKAYCLVIYHFS